ncbi:macro domain-containing protein [Nitratidesulfovibrio sp. SRB-5]|uniref:macro domain-containing protein n=1 Tax=Nitratidesulfovibrio sp. SRB-5 TaxID=2872636 RepID=UPI001CC123B3|nr:macro domain-containing protein [Nitratidesulfovibrio sp. SRB-5]MBZ2171872.1 macro domain-containing protein [Nitratidesulfovibrio sp. SRB-5]
MDDLSLIITAPTGHGLLVVSTGDLAATATDAVVNAANAELRGGGGVDGALHCAAGPMLLPAGQDIVARRGPLAAGEAVITPGFNLPARHVIHAVGPIWRGGTHGEPQALAEAHANSLRLAAEHGLARVAFPAISCGSYGYPPELAAPIALAEAVRGLRAGLVREVRFVLHGLSMLAVWRTALQALSGPRAPVPEAGDDQSST